MLADFFHGLFLQITECGMKSQNPRYIGSSGLETIRKKCRYFFRMRGASCSTADKRLNLRCQFIADQKATCSLWPSESLVTCKCQCVYVTFLHINVNGSCRLCTQKRRPFITAKGLTCVLRGRRAHCIINQVPMESLNLNANVFKRTIE